MRNVLLVLQREYLQRVRTRAFVIGTIAAPLLLLAIVVVPVVIEARGDGAERRIVLVDHTGVLAEALVPRLASGGLVVEEVDPEAPESGRLRERALSGEIAGIVEVDAETLERGRARWIGEDPPSAIRSLSLRQAITQTALAQRLGETGSQEAVAALLEGGTLEIERLGTEASDGVERGRGLAAGLGGAFLLYMVLLVYGSMVLRAVLEEKTGRIVEVIVSSLEPWELMLGKVLGVGATGLTQIGIWILSGVLIAGLGLPTIVAFLPDPGAFDAVRDLLPGAGVVGFFLLCFLLGYFIYASLFAAVAAMCSTEQEAQQLQFPVVLLVVVPIVVLPAVMEDPGSPFAVGASLFPFFSPILMFARVAAGGVPLWQPVLAVAGMAATLFATAWVAGRIYRVGILMQGKRPTLPELVRWIREA